METIILICLLLIIILLLHDRIHIGNNYRATNKSGGNGQKEIDDIMGLPRSSINKGGVGNDSKESLAEGLNPENGISEEQNNGDETLEIDLEAEEEEWRDQSYYLDEEELAEGVTFEELQSLSEFVQDRQHQNASQNQLLATAKKIQGTELFSLLESSIEGASKKIAQLLDSTLSSGELPNKETPDQFNIENYL